MIFLTLRSLVEFFRLISCPVQTFGFGCCVNSHVRVFTILLEAFQTLQTASCQRFPPVAIVRSAGPVDVQSVTFARTFLTHSVTFASCGDRVQRSVVNFSELLCYKSEKLKVCGVCLKLAPCRWSDMSITMHIKYRKLYKT